MIGRIRSASGPYLAILPGGIWLAAFFILPLFIMLSLSTQTGNLITGFEQTFHFANYSNMLSEYRAPLIRSLVYGGIATLISVIISYPMAYWIAFYGGRNKSTYLFLVLLPFFVTFVLRTVAWEFLLGDQGLVLSWLKNAGIVGSDFHVLATGPAVIGGLVYNYMPFTLLPIYVALEKVDVSLLEAAGDLYASKRQAFLRIVFPLTVPGIFAGVLLTFVPAVSDYVNAAILGGTDQTMIGNVIQTLYLTNSDYPDASALSIVLMAILLIGIFIYAKALGTQDLLDAAAG
ncbi:MAG TPA: ABC transporter permease [Mycobacteriales bacterium]|nr:ABC transporter permease [Mycobacteriales bacterium]